MTPNTYASLSTKWTLNRSFPLNQTATNRVSTTASFTKNVTSSSAFSTSSNSTGAASPASISSPVTTSASYNSPRLSSGYGETSTEPSKQDVWCGLFEHFADDSVGVDCGSNANLLFDLLSIAMTTDMPFSPSRPATVSAGMEQKRQVKVWRPQGFEGLEVTDVVRSKEPLVRTSLDDYFITVGLVGPAYISYRGSRNVMHGPLFSVYQAGEVLSSGPEEKTWSFRGLRLTPEYIEQLATSLGDGSPGTYFPEAHINGKPLNIRLSTLVYDTCRSFLEPAATLERESRLLTLVSEVIRYCADDPPPNCRLGKEHRAVGLMKGYLREHFTDDVTLADLSKLVGLNKTYLLEVFKRDVGISPHGYLTCARINKAKHLLRQGLPIAQVALETGFCDQSHLNRLFKRYVLVTPGRFQQASLS